MEGARGVIWRAPNISGDGLKNFACAAMLIQTAGVAVVQNGMIHVRSYGRQQLSEALAADSDLMMLAGMGSVMQLIGGLAVPIFAFLLVEGFRNTSDYRRYLLSVFSFALLSEVPYDLAMYGKLVDASGQNALFSMTVSLLMLYFLRMGEERAKQRKGERWTESGGGEGDREKGDRKKGFGVSRGGWGISLGIWRALVILSAVIWVSLFRCGYGLCTVLLTACFYLLYGANVLKTLLGIVISLLYVTAPLSFYGLWCYDGTRKNRIPKYAYYLFYPLHLLVLGIVAGCIL